jgi:hypothetical protein
MGNQNMWPLQWLGHHYVLQPIIAAHVETTMRIKKTRATGRGQSKMSVVVTKSLIRSPNELPIANTVIPNKAVLMLNIIPTQR